MKILEFTYRFLVFFLLPSLWLAAGAQETMGVIVPGTPLYCQSDYESALDQELMLGTVVSVDSSDRYWRHVSFGGYSGWVNELALAPVSDSFLKGRKMMCRVACSLVRCDRSSSSEVLCPVFLGDVVASASGFHLGKMEVILPDGVRGYASASDFRPVGGTVDMEDAISTALGLVGTAYLWGGNTVGGIDCSGLVWLCCRVAGVDLPRNSGEQALVGEEVYRYNGGTADPSSLRRGDLVCFGNPSSLNVNHVGIYLGEGRFVHSSQLVRISSLDPASPDYYSSKTLLSVRRLVQ